MSDLVVEQPAVVEADLNDLVGNGVKPATYAYEPPAGVPLCSGVDRTGWILNRNGLLRDPQPGRL